MEKKLYEKPQLRAIEIKNEQCLLAGSVRIGAAPNGDGDEWTENDRTDDGYDTI